MKIRTITTLFLLVLFVWQGCQAQTDIKPIVEAFEVRMQKAARLWLDGKYFEAIDGFNSAKEWIDERLPSPSNPYPWLCATTLKTYALLMIRLVQSAYYKSENRMVQYRESVKQAENWSTRLKRQIEMWEVVQPANSEEYTLREAWKKRIQLAIRRTEKMAAD
jgi:hypothetical protein